MKGTILDFLKLANEKPEFAQALVDLAAKHDFEFLPPDEVSDEELDKVSGGNKDVSESASQADYSDVTESAVDEAKAGARAALDLWKVANAVASAAAKRLSENSQYLNTI